MVCNAALRCSDTRGERQKHQLRSPEMAAARKTYTRHCDYCDTDYQVYSNKGYRGQGQVFTSCGKPDCIRACTEAYNAQRIVTREDRAAIRAARPRTPRPQVMPATDWNYLVAFSNARRV